MSNCNSNIPSVLCQLYGYTYRTLVIEIFLKNPKDKQYVTQIRRKLKTDGCVIYKILPSLINSGMIIKCPKTKIYQYYILNVDNPLTQLYLKLYRTCQRELSSNQELRRKLNEF